MVFIDASFFLAYYNSRDLHHTKALALWSDIEKGKYGSYFTTDYIFNEVVGVTLRKLEKKIALVMGEQILKTIFILNIDDHLLIDAWRLFSTTQFNFNLVDCTSITAIKTMNIHQIATFDKEFNNLRNIKVVQ